MMRADRPTMLQKVPFDALCLAAVVEELRPFLGGRVQKAQMAADTGLALQLYAGRADWFLIDWDARRARAHFLRGKPEKGRATSLLEAVRARVVGGRLMAVQQVAGDRILSLTFASEAGEHRLIAELMGRHANVVLLGEADRILAAAKTVGPSKSRRPLVPGRTYLPPPVLELPGPLGVRTGPFLDRLLLAGGNALYEALANAVRTGTFQPSRTEIGPYPWPLDTLGIPSEPLRSYSDGASDTFAAEQHQDAIEERRRRLVQQLERVLFAREVALQGLNHALSQASEADRWQREGELLLAYAHAISPGVDRVDLTGFDGEPVSFAIDPEQSPVENAQVRFVRAKRARDSREEVARQRARLAEEHQELVAFLSQVRYAEHDLEALETEARARRWTMPDRSSAGSRERPFDGKRVREIEGPRGYRIFYGENAEANDYLITRVAKPNDWWLHVRGAASAHVVIATQNQPERTPPEVIRFAAEVAVRQSPLKHSRIVPVDYTLRKYVRRPRGAPPGTVTYSHEKTLHIDGV